MRTFGTFLALGIFTLTVGCGSGNSSSCTLTHCAAPTPGSQLFEFSDSCCGDGAVAFTSHGETLTCGNVVVTCTTSGSGGSCSDNMGATCKF
jgi:hypothetical protein